MLWLRIEQVVHVGSVVDDHGGPRRPKARTRSDWPSVRNRRRQGRKLTPKLINGKRLRRFTHRTRWTRFVRAEPACGNAGLGPRATTFSRAPAGCLPGNQPTSGSTVIKLGTSTKWPWPCGFAAGGWGGLEPRRIVKKKTAREGPPTTAPRGGPPPGTICSLGRAGSIL